MEAPPPDQIDKMDSATFFGLFANLPRDDPPGPFDYPIIHRLERIGFKVGQNFDLNAASPEIKQAFELGTAAGKEQVLAAGKKAAGEGGKGWVYSTTGGAFGVEYLYRAAIAQCCLGYNLPPDAVYPSVSIDSDGRPLSGNNRYILHFKEGQFPPVDGFWSVTAYDKDGYFIPNALNHFALGDHDKLATNADGTLDLLIQSDSPGTDKESNWLPVAKAPFNLMLRFYSPHDVAIDGTWTTPLVKRVD